jgi:hypothetical protein
MIDEHLNEYKGPNIPEDTIQKLDDIIKDRIQKKIV